MSEVYKQKLEKIIKECDKHILRMGSASKKMSVFMPLTLERYNALNEDEIMVIDQFLFRFSKLQDTMGQRLFKSFLIYLEEDIERLAFIDILNRLEKLQILQVEDWRRLREYRNELSHNYEDEAEISTNIINNLYNKQSTIITIYSNIKQRIVSDINEYII